MNLLKRREREPLTAEERAATAKRERREREQKETLVEPVRRGRQLRVDVAKLTLREAQELRELHMATRRETDDGVGYDLNLLDAKQRKRLAKLLDQCLSDAERERQRVLREERGQRALQAWADEQVNAGVPPVRRLGLKAGEVVLPASVVELGTLHVGDIGTLAVLMHAWSSGRVPFAEGRWSDDGTALIVGKRLRFLDPELNRAYDRDGFAASMVNLDRTLEHLTRNGFLDAQRDAQGWVIRLGPLAEA